VTKIKMGYVVLGGVKLWVQVWHSGKNHWVSTYKSLDADNVPRLMDVEKRLKKIRHAPRSLMEQKVVAI
jgi:hypothetical protein